MKRIAEEADLAPNGLMSRRVIPKPGYMTEKAVAFSDDHGKSMSDGDVRGNRVTYVTFAFGRWRQQRATCEWMARC